MNFGGILLKWLQRFEEDAAALRAGAGIGTGAVAVAKPTAAAHAILRLTISPVNALNRISLVLPSELATAQAHFYTCDQKW